MKIVIEIDSKNVLDALNRLQQAATRPRPALLEIGEELVESTKERFGAQTAPDGSRWAPNSPVTIARSSLPHRQLRRLLTVENFSLLVIQGLIKVGYDVLSIKCP